MGKTKKNKIQKIGKAKTAYIWKSGAVVKTSLSPQKVGEELERLRAQTGGELRPIDVIEAAASTRSALHSYFEWDDSKAAAQHRLQQARALIASIAVRAERGREKRLYVSVRKGSNKKTSQMGGKGSIYVEREGAFKDETLREQLRAKAVHELERWAERYEPLRLELMQVFSAIEDLKSIDWDKVA